MHKRREGWNVVLAGFWNRMIFTPEWVGPRLFSENAQLETVVALLPILPIIYRDDQVAVEVASTRIVCRARDIENDSALRRTGEIAETILRALPETPVEAVGVNFAFREESPDDTLLDLFNLADNARWGESGWKLDERKIVRRLTGNGDTLNLTLNLNGDRLDIDFNFHSDPDDSAAAITSASADRVIGLRNRAIQVMNDLYGLELERNEFDG